MGIECIPVHIMFLLSFSQEHSFAYLYDLLLLDKYATNGSLPCIKSDFH